MFPLGTVVLPGMPLPLRIFELRYQLMLHDVMAGDQKFGVVLIERGSEVGGGDSRSNVGTLVRIYQHQAMDEGQHAILAFGEERIRVEKWLPDDPYPRAEVSVWPDGAHATADDSVDSIPHDGTSNDAELLGMYAKCISSLRHLLATAAELGHQVAPSTFEAPEDPVSGSYLLAALTPVGPFDKQRLLTVPGAQDRLPLLASLIVDQLDLITGEATQG